MTPRLWDHGAPSSREYRARRRFAVAVTLAGFLAWVILGGFVCWVAR